MGSEPDKFLNGLVVAALTVFIVVIVLISALVIRQYWLQQRIAQLSSDVEFNLESLEETTEEIQRELSERQGSAQDALESEGWEEISETLEDVDLQLDVLEEDIGEVALALESQSETTQSPVEDADRQEIDSDPIDQVFTVFAIVVAIASIVIAILLASALRIQELHRKRDSSLRRLSSE